MAGGGAWSRRVAARTRTLRGLVRDTQRALHDVCDILNFDPEVPVTVQDIGSICNRPTAIVVLGTSAAARARLLNCLLGRQLLPDPAPRGCRWLKIQYGSSTQVHLTLGNSEFELVEELECNKRSWDTLPLRDLLRQDHNDLSTMLEVELNNTFLKDGLRIIVPPDIEVDSGVTSYLTLKQTHLDLYNKREMILRNFNPVYLYALDRIGRNIFSDNIGDSMVTSRSEEDFWNSFSLYSTPRVSEVNEVKKEVIVDKVVKESDNGEPAVFAGENCLDLHQIKEINPHSQLLFILFSDSTDLSHKEVEKTNEATESAEDMYRAEDLPESDQDLMEPVLRRTQESPINSKKSTANRRLREEQIGFMNELLDQWELMCSPPPKHHVKSQWIIANDVEILRTVDLKPLAPYLSTAIQHAGETLGKGKADSAIHTRSAFLSTTVKFAAECSQSSLLECSTQLSEVHVKLLQQFILASFDLARELQVVPKKIQYVATQEQQLFETINNKFSEGDKKQELVAIMQEVLQEMQTEVNNMDWSVDDLPCHQDRRFMVSNSIFYSTRSSPPPPPAPPAPPAPSSREPTSDGEEALSYDSYNFDDYEIINERDESLSMSYLKSNSEDASVVISQAGRIRVENEETFSLSHAVSWANATVCTNAGNVSVKEASLDVQQTVLSKLSRKISLKLVNFVDCLRETYFGTLQRCLESLELSCRQELGGRPASEAMRQLLFVARQVQLQPTGSFSLLRSLLDSLRRLIHRLRLAGEESETACCALSPVWRRRVALHTLHSLTPTRLARIISAQILEKLTVAHEKYQSALIALEAALEGRLHHTEAVKLAIRKKYAPAFARLCLESTSMCDLLMYGTPELGREIGRGQYGVVYSVRGGWAGHSPVAVKSVLPADDRHYHELAMEFFYTRSIPAHPRIVRLLGSVVQRAGGGACAGVLLVCARRERDLHAAVRAGLARARRLRVATDIVEGIRYLHSLGLVHRDIKMKNVLLDHDDRAALSDLGFCAAEALISGSVVGTPVHMAPELLRGEYDAAVDVYAFGVLFWYLCAGNVKLPDAFEMFVNKEQLWSGVKRGVRPERLPHFTDECWDIMTSCWASEPSQRALLGDIQPRLERILQQALTEDQGKANTNTEVREYDSEDSLNMTGIDGDLD
ncbi:dual serine/threonine and tyrosine protein kinase-like isoform X2 [Plodia interpunctella]|uniref:dual serine/threonine and tyrosine protein kinase-like isoform X2 n=1 Tax=Plodia interpunctella TaxID=58824 RepID=UPI002368EFCB|nr:dual serine/threonine and tyrosine protein kinase-like isoform X2 [Plodia interpunctella]